MSEVDPLPVTRSGRPNLSGTRGGQGQISPLPLAEEQYSKDNEQKFRKQLGDILSPLQQAQAATAKGLNTLTATDITNNSIAPGDTVGDALTAIELVLDALPTSYQPLDSDLTAIAALATTTFGRALLTLANATALAALVDSFFLTPAEGNAAYQPLDSDLTAIAALTTTSYGRALLALADAAALRSTADAEQIGVITGVNTQTASYAFVIGDKGKTVEINAAGSTNLTVPAHGTVAFAVGTYLNFAQIGAGQITVTPDGGVTLRARNGLKTAGQYAMGTMYQRASDDWVVGGDLTT